MTEKRMPPEAELTRLADGTLPGDREAELRAEVRDAPQLAAALAEQEHAVRLLQSVDEPAPARLQARVAGHRRVAARRRRLGQALALPVATALAVLIAGVVVLVGGGAGAPTVPQTARLALSAATLPGPAVDPANPYLLGLRGAGIPFPNWGASTGYAPAGARRDRLAGRTVTTVFYRGPTGRRVGYAIVSGPPLADVRGRRVTAGAVHFTLARTGAGRLITWVQSGHTCVVASRTVTYGRLLALVGSGG